VQPLFAAAGIPTKSKTLCRLLQFGMSGPADRRIKHQLLTTHFGLQQSTPFQSVDLDNNAILYDHSDLPETQVLQSIFHSLNHFLFVRLWRFCSVRRRSTVSRHVLHLTKFQNNPPDSLTCPQDNAVMDLVAERRKPSGEFTTHTHRRARALPLQTQRLCREKPCDAHYLP
jgi:hypothetical protein